MASSGVSSSLAPRAWAWRAAAMIFCALAGMSPTTKLSCAVQIENIMELNSKNKPTPPAPTHQAPMAEPAITVPILASVLDVDASAWNALLAQQSQPTPFMRHEYLAA